MAYPQTLGSQVPAVQRRLCRVPRRPSTPRRSETVFESAVRLAPVRHDVRHKRAGARSARTVWTAMKLRSTWMTSISHIPIVDLAAVRALDPAGLRDAAAAIRDACTSIGFFYVSNHGVPIDVLESVVKAAREFFAYPVEVKRRVAVNHRHRGFNALGDAVMYQATKPDYKEFFSIGLELPEDDPSVLAGEALRGPNNWPDFMPSLQPVLYSYYEAIGACGADLLRAVAVSLDIDEAFFVSKYTKRMQRTQMVYYPPQAPKSDADQFGVAPHTDYGCITLLR